MAVTDLGWSIVLDTRPDSPDRDAALREAAMMPKIHRVWDRYEGEIPDDAHLQTLLTMDSTSRRRGPRHSSSSSARRWSMLA